MKKLRPSIPEMRTKKAKLKAQIVTMIEGGMTTAAELNEVLKINTDSLNKRLAELAKEGRIRREKNRGNKWTFSMPSCNWLTHNWFRTMTNEQIGVDPGAASQWH